VVNEEGTYDQEDEGLHGQELPGREVQDINYMRGLHVHTGHLPNVMRIADKPENLTV